MTETYVASNTSAQATEVAQSAAKQLSAALAEGCAAKAASLLELMSRVAATSSGGLPKEAISSCAGALGATAPEVSSGGGLGLR